MFWPLRTLTHKLKELAAPAQAHDDWIVPCAKDLKANAGKSLVHGAVTGCRWRRICWSSRSTKRWARSIIRLNFVRRRLPRKARLAELAAALNGGQVQTLVILGGNPGL